MPPLLIYMSNTAEKHDSFYPLVTGRESASIVFSLLIDACQTVSQVR
jgi:hypothetical protein